MSEQEKINIVINEINKVYNLDSKKINIIKDNIIKRSELYKNVVPNINNNEISFINNPSTLTDILLNRLINNIRIYNFEEQINLNATDKGTYTSKEQKIHLESYGFVKQISREKLKNRIQNVTEETINKSTLKVINHEFGHVLQTSFNGINGNNNEKIEQLLNNLNSKYPEVFKSYNSFSNKNMEEIQHGMTVIKPQKIETEEEKARNFYFLNAYTTNIDEIFNEDEALKITNINEPQFSYEYGNGFNKKIYNYESSNYRITSYARMMKLIMGQDRVYKSMYEDSFETYKFFDQFINISEEVFNKNKTKTQPPMFHILNCLENIKKNNNLEDMNKLDLFFTNVLKQKIIHELKNPNLNMESLNEIINIVKEFKNHMLENKNIMLEQKQIILEIQNMIDKKYKELKKPIISNAKENILEENKENTEYFYKKMIESIKSYNHTLSPEQKQQLMGQIFYYEGYFIKNIKDNEAMDYLNKVINDISTNKFEENVQNIIYNDLQEKFKNIKSQNSNNNLINTIKEEYNKINKRYREMFSDKYIDSEELEELINIFKNFIKITNDKKIVCTNSKEIDIINIMIQTIEKEQQKLIAIQSATEENNKKFSF